MRRYTLALLFFLGAPAMLSAALTLDEISLMLRSGFSSEEVVQRVVVEHFVGTFDAEAEKRFVALKASPVLMEALKSEKYANTGTPSSMIYDPRQQVKEVNELSRKALQHQVEELRKEQTPVSTPSSQTNMTGSVSPGKVVTNVAARSAAAVQRRIRWKENPGDRVAEQAAKRSQRAADEGIRPDVNDPEAQEIRRKLEWTIQAHRNEPASSLSISGADFFPRSEGAQRVKEKYEAAIKEAGDHPASTIRVPRH